MRRQTLGVIWLLGAIFAAALYAAGPDHFLARAGAWLRDWGEQLNDALLLMSAASFELLRSATLALFAVFVALAILAARRGLRARMALVVVPIVALILMDHGPSGAAPRWFMAFVLLATGAGVMTNRLLRSMHPATGPAPSPFNQ